MTGYLIAAATFVVALATFAVTTTVLSPHDEFGPGHTTRSELLRIAVRTLFLADGSDVSPRATALLLPLAQIALGALAGSTVACLRVVGRLRGGDPYR